MPTVVIADDHEIVRSGIKLVLSQHNNLTLVAEASNGIEAISAIKQYKPDIVLLDMSMPYANALNVYCESRRWSRHSKVIVFTGIISSVSLTALFNEGVDSILLKEGGNENISQAIACVLANQRFIPDNVMQLITPADPLALLTRREKQILQLIIAGNTNTQISQTLSISKKTVDNHRTNLMKKLNVHCVAELIACALRKGVLDTV